MASRDDDFLSRWSRRKVESRQGLRKKEPAREAKEGQAAKELAPDAKEPYAARAEPSQAKVASLESDRTFAEQLRIEESEETIPQNLTPPARDEETSGDEAGLEDFKDLDFSKLNYSSDYTRFMEKGVPEAVRKRALRALWGSNPLLANIDGLNDYDEDFTDAALAVKGLLQTAYKPGTGYLTEEERLASYSDEARKAEPPEDAGVEDMDDLDEPDAAGDEEESGEGQEVADADDASGAKSGDPGAAENEKA